jgi:mitochondrial protein import protein ZIM17
MRIPTASFAIRALSRFSHSRLRNLHTLPLPLSRTLQQQPRLFSTSFQAFNSSTNIPPKQAQKSRLVEQPDNPQPPSPKRPDQPSYDITFTCTPCSTRSTHRITKQGYHHGSILITCPSCRNRHVISDHLNVSALSLGRCGG